MIHPNISVNQFVKNQVKKWERAHTKDSDKKGVRLPVITIAMQPGSGGSVIASQLAERLEFDWYHRDVVEQIAKSAKIRSAVVNTLEKKRRTGVEDFISSLIEDQYLHPDSYLNHLLVVISTIAKHGHAVIVGRGANFILPPEDIFSVRVIAPLETRVKNVAVAYRVSTKEARKRVMQRQSKRKAFVRQSFHADISDPLHYDLVINTGKISIEAAVEAIIAAVLQLGKDKKGR
jgi:cytidylate kinase